MRTRIFLRTSEFLWQEGHTAHATSQEAQERTALMLDVYARMAEEYMAMPVIKGSKTAAERFPGAVDTQCIEAMMQDCKALQAGTSHFLGQNFARASNIRFQTADEEESLAWTTSWGTSTRLIGGLIMCHGDDDGLRVPPKVAPAHIVLLPIVHKEADRAAVMAYIRKLAEDLRTVYYHQRPLRVEVDAREIGGVRGWEWIKKGVPLRVEIGPRDMAKDSVFVGRRDHAHKDKRSMSREQFIGQATAILDDIQASMLSQARAFRKAHTREINRQEEFYAFFTPHNPEKPEIHGGFAMSHWCGQAACENKIKEELAVTIRCLPFDAPQEAGTCICCGGPSHQRVVFAKAY